MGLGTPSCFPAKKHRSHAFIKSERETLFTQLQLVAVRFALHAWSTLKCAKRSEIDPDALGAERFGTTCDRSQSQPVLSAQSFATLRFARRYELHTRCLFEHAHVDLIVFPFDHVPQRAVALIGLREPGQESPP